MRIPTFIVEHPLEALIAGVLLLAAVAKETPWIAIIGAGVAAAANMFLNRNKSGK